MQLTKHKLDGDVSAQRVVDRNDVISRQSSALLCRRLLIIRLIHDEDNASSSTGKLTCFLE